MAVIMNFPAALGWQGREQRFNKMNALYGKPDTAYVLFVYEEKLTFEKGFEKLNTREKNVYATKGDLTDVMDELRLWDFHSNQLISSRDGKIVLRLKEFPKADFIRKPKERFIEGYFYLLTEEAFEKIPFESNPMTKKRDSLFACYLSDSVKLTEKLETYLTEYLEPIRTSKTETSAMKYHVIIKENLEGYVPKNENKKALEIAEKHQLTNLEFNFLNYFYETNKALRNDVGQLFFDPTHNGIGWHGSRGWVKKQMARLIKLGLVKFEARHDCRDRRFTSWYFYKAGQSLDRLKHDF